LIAGTLADAAPDGRLFRSEEGEAGLWFGNVDDLWRLGTPRGEGGPWRDTPVAAGEPSDPYLMTNYDRKRLALSHNAGMPVAFTLEVDFAGDGTWHEYGRFAVAPGRATVHEFPDGYGAHWVRLSADRECAATATFAYE